MANEVTYSLSLKAVKGLYEFDFSPAAVRYTWTGHNGILNTIALTDSYAAISKGAVGSIAAFVIANPDTVKTITISLDAGTTGHMTILPGRFFVIPLAAAFDVATNLRVKASVAFDAVGGFLEV